MLKSFGFSGVATDIGCPRLSEDLLDPLTQRHQVKSTVSGVAKLKADLQVKSVFNQQFILSFLFELLRNVRSKTKAFSQLWLFERIDYCGTFLREDYDLLKRHYPFKMDWIDARFVSLEKLIGDLKVGIINGSNVLLGNSCTMENNHLDVIDRLSGVELEQGSKVICPLNYGKNLGSYQRTVVALGYKILGRNFDPLLVPLPLTDYLALQKTCSHAIMYHNRQQAFNNVLALVFLGVKVYLKPNNTIYQYLKRLGCTVFSTDELIDQNHLTPLSDEERKSNRALIFEEFSDKKIAASVEKIEALDTSN